MASRNQTAAKKSGKGRAKKLNRAALKLVDEKAKEIANSLYESTLAGHVLSARFLVDLAERDVETEHPMRMRPLHSTAKELASEPEWQHDDADPDIDPCEDVEA
jgi:hypothetical protein